MYRPNRHSIARLCYFYFIFVRLLCTCTCRFSALFHSHSPNLCSTFCRCRSYGRTAHEVDMDHHRRRVEKATGRVDTSKPKAFDLMRPLPASKQSGSVTAARSAAGSAYGASDARVGRESKSSLTDAHEVPSDRTKVRLLHSNRVVSKMCCAWFRCCYCVTSSAVRRILH